MCGLSGIVGTIDVKHDSVFRDLLYLHALRGADSTGFGGAYRDDGDSTWFKVVGGAWEMLDHKTFDKFMRLYYRVLFGHNRSATVGAASIDNAHPFLHQGPYSKAILGMHNGTLKFSTNHDLKDGTKFGTDSEAIIHSIAYEGPEKTIPKMEGAWALAWYDEQRNTVSLLRNSERPLCFVLSKDERTLFFGSEVSLVSAALRRHAMEVGQFFVLNPDIMHTWKIPKTDEKFEAPETLKLEGKLVLPTKASAGTYEWEWKDGRYIKTGGQSASSSNIKSLFGQRGGGTGTNSNPTGSSGTTKPPNGNKPSGCHTNGSNFPKKYTAFKGLVTEGPFLGLSYYGELEEFRIYFDRKNRYWIQAVWDTDKKDWETLKFRFAPPNLPFSVLDINANHAFKHVGKKKNKQIFFRGWKGSPLIRMDAETFFAYGCSSCQRVPEWGNEVLWINKEHDFLCEFCSQDESLVKSWSDVAA